LRLAARRGHKGALAPLRLIVTTLSPRRLTPPLRLILARRTTPFAAGKLGKRLAASLARRLPGLGLLAPLRLPPWCLTLPRGCSSGAAPLFAAGKLERRQTAPLARRL